MKIIMSLWKEFFLFFFYFSKSEKLYVFSLFPLLCGKVYSFNVYGLWSELLQLVVPVKICICCLCQ